MIENESASDNAISPNRLSKSQIGYSEVAYLGVVQLENKNKSNIDWTVTVQANHKSIAFKIDSGDDHSVLHADVFKNAFQNAKLEPPNKILCGQIKSIENSWEIQGKSGIQGKELH